MAEYPVFPLWTDAYLADTSHLTTLEHGAYLLLLIAMWRADGALPNDDLKLSRFARLTPGQWRRIRPTIMPFFRVSGTSISQGRLTDEIEAVRQKSKSQHSKAKARWLKTKETRDAAASSGQCRSDASLSPSSREAAAASFDVEAKRASEPDAVRANGADPHPPPASQPPPCPLRERAVALLPRAVEAAGADPAKDISGRWFSSIQRDAVLGWIDLGLEDWEILETIREVAGRMPTPPKTLRYFDGAMADRAERKRRPPGGPSKPPNGGGGGRGGGSGGYGPSVLTQIQREKAARSKPPPTKPQARSIAGHLRIAACGGVPA